MVFIPMRHGLSTPAAAAAAVVMVRAAAVVWVGVTLAAATKSALHGVDLAEAAASIVVGGGCVGAAAAAAAAVVVVFGATVGVAGGGSKAGQATCAGTPGPTTSPPLVP